MSDKLHSEMTLLSVLIKDGSLIEKMEVKPEHLEGLDHKVIYENMLSLYSKKIPIDFETLATELGKKIEDVGNVTYLLKLEDYAPTTKNYEYYEQNVFKYYRSRKGHDLIKEYNKDRTDEAALKLKLALEELERVGIKDTRKSTYDHYVEIGEQIAEGPNPMREGYKTGLTTLDNATGGLQRGNLIVFGARTSMGKTALALHCAMELSGEGGVPHIMTYEMSTKDLLQRLISTTGNIDGDVWLNNNFSVEHYKKAIDAIGKLSEEQLEVYTWIKKIREMKVIMRDAIEKQPDKKHMLIVDGVNFVNGEKNHKSRTYEIEEIVEDLKELAEELEIPVILVSQINRGAENRDDKRPFMSDLKDSGSLEQVADLIVLLYRDSYYNEDSDFPNNVELNIAKQRNGGKGTFNFRFVENTGKFLNLID